MLEGTINPLRDLDLALVVGGCFPRGALQARRGLVARYLFDIDLQDRRRLLDRRFGQLVGMFGNAPPVPDFQAEGVLVL